MPHAQKACQKKDKHAYLKKVCHMPARHVKKKEEQKRKEKKRKEKDSPHPQKIKKREG